MTATPTTLNLTAPQLTPLDQNNSASLYAAYELKRNAIFDAPDVVMQNEMISGDAELTGTLALAELQIAPSPFSELFFSAANYNEMHNRIRWAVYQQTNKVVPLQKQSSLEIIAQRIYDEFIEMPRNFMEYTAEIDRLNNLVRDQAAHIIVSEMTSYARYRRDATERVFLQTSENVTTTGTKGIGYPDPRNAFGNL